MRGKKREAIQSVYGYVAMDSDLQVFAGYSKGYPIWSSDTNDCKEINGDTHIHSLRRWFPEKQIELIKL